MEARDDQTNGSDIFPGEEAAGLSAGQQLAAIVKSIFRAYRNNEAPAEDAPAASPSG